jgi:hypothetical protein
MAECFCGCGRKVRFRDRGLNYQGRGTAELVAKLRETRALVIERGPLREGGNVEPLVTQLDEYIAEGEGAEQLWSGVLHRELEPGASEALQYKGEWRDWFKKAKALNDLASAPVDVQLQVWDRMRDPG